MNQPTCLANAVERAQRGCSSTDSSITPTMLAPSRSRAALCSAPIATLPSFLVPALAASASAARRTFSASTAQQSKLGRTPISVPPGVELTIGEPYIKRDYTTYKQTPRRNVSVAGPLGTSATATALVVSEARAAGDWATR